MKTKVHYLLNENKWVVQFIYYLIILNIIALIIESFTIDSHYLKDALNIIELVSVIIFTIEYFLRLWSADAASKSIKSSFKSRLKFFFSPLGVIDLLAILPFYLPMFFAIDMRSLRILRLFRLLRIFKLGRYSKSMRLIQNVLKDTKSDLLVTIFISFILITLSSTLMYYIEHEAQPEQFRNVGQSLWWSIATLTTVGYGDIYPITPLGKILGAFTALIGIGFVALPTGIISSAFIAKLNQANHKKTTHCICPNCHTEFEVNFEK